MTTQTRMIPLTKFASDFTSYYALHKQVYAGKCTTKGEVHGSTYKFIINPPPGLAKKRQSNGMLPTSPFGQSEFDINLEEYGLKMTKRKFEYETASTPSKEGMVKAVTDAMNLTIRNAVQDELYNSNSNYADSTTPINFNIDIAMDWQTEIEEEIGDDEDGNIFMEVSLRAWNILMKNEEFSSGDYVSDKPFMAERSQAMRNWNGATWCRKQSP